MMFKNRFIRAAAVFVASLMLGSSGFLSSRTATSASAASETSVVSDSASYSDDEILNNVYIVKGSAYTDIGSAITTITINRTTEDGNTANTPYYVYVNPKYNSTITKLNILSAISEIVTVNPDSYAITADTHYMFYLSYVGGGAGEKDISSKLIIRLTKTDSSTLEKQIDLNIINPAGKSWTDTVGEFLSKSSVIIVVATLCCTILFKVGMTIFRFGVNYKSAFMSKEDGEVFKQEMRNQYSTSKAELQDNILKICLREISRETKPVGEIQSLAEQLKTDKEVMNVQLKTIQEKYDDINKLSNEVSNLERIVRTIQYGDTTSTERRSGK